MNNKSGFTLLEIIIVLIIIGVLASLALPKFFSTVEYSRSAEALRLIGSTRESLQRCYLMQRDYDNCTLANIDFDPTETDNPHFTYTKVDGGVNGFTITATRNTLDGGTAGDTINFSYASGVVTRTGTGAFAGVN